MFLAANSVQENFEQLKSENNDNKLLINKLFDEVRELKKGIAKVSQNNFHTCIGCTSNTRHVHMTSQSYVL